MPIWFNLLFCNSSCVNEYILQALKNLLWFMYTIARYKKSYQIIVLTLKIEEQIKEQNKCSDLAVNGNRYFISFTLLYHKLVNFLLRTHIWISEPSTKTKWHEEMQILRMGVKIFPSTFKWPLVSGILGVNIWDLR